MSKSQINLPKTAFSMKANLPIKEPEILEYWKKISLYEKLRNEIVSNHVSFWLDCSNETLINRIMKNKRRPLANKLTNKELIELIIKRKKNYIKANFRIDCNKFNKIQTVNNIIKLYETI